MTTVAKIKWIISALALAMTLQAQAQISGPTSVCSGVSNTYTYTGAYSGGFHYIIWSPGGGRSNSPVKTHSISFTSNGTVEVQVYVNEGGTDVLEDTETLSVTVKSVGSISGPSSLVCPSTSFNLTNTGASGTSFTWQSSPSGANTWTNISSNSANSTISKTATAKTDYRLALTDCSTTYYSNTVTVDVYGAPTDWGTISESGATTICTGSTPTAFTNTASATSYGNDVTYQWQQKTTGSWSNISGATSTTYAPGALTQTTSYQRIATWGCNSSNNGASNTITITVSSSAVGGTLSYSGGPTFCGSGTINLTLSGYTGTVVGWYYQQQINSGGWGSWTLFSTTNAATNSYFAATPNGSNSNYQFYALVQNGVCSANSTTAGGTAIVIYSTYGSTVSSSYFTATTPNLLIESYGVATGSFMLNTGFYAGSFENWQQNTGSGWVTATGSPNNVSTYTYTNLLTTTQYRAIFANGGCTFYSPIVYDSIFQVPSIALADTTTKATLALGSTLVLQSGTTYHSYQWIKNGVDITTANGFPANATSWQYTVTEPAQYSLRVQATATSASATTGAYTISPLGYQTDNSDNITVTTVIRKAGVRPATDLYTLQPGTYSQSALYTDALSRPIQTIVVGQSPLQNDLIQPYAYDTLNTTAYLPFASSKHSGLKKYTALSNGSYAGSDQYQFYHQTTTKVAYSTAPYAVTTRENSPLGRTIKQGAPGAKWQPGAHAVKPWFHMNASSEVKIWTTAGPGSYYAANALSVSVVVNENGDSVLAYTDNLGHTVLKRSAINATVEGTSLTYLDTYYVYDNFGQLVMQVPPKAVALLNGGATWNSTFCSTWCFTYTYNGTGHLVQKTSPGTAAMYYAYDTLGRLVLSQDGNLRANNQWTFIKYDAQGRPVMSGLYTDATHTTLSSITSLVSGQYSGSGAWYESRGTTLHGYTNQSFPTANADASALTVLSVNYYDTYDFDFSGSDDYSYTSQSIKGEQTQGNSFGLPTGSKKLILGTTTWLYSYTFYDRFGRAIQTRTNNHLQSSIDNLITVGYDFEGKVLATKTYHDAGGSNQVTLLDTTSYDYAGRPVKLYRSINGSVYQLLAQYSYNELGQMVDKQLHNTGGSSFLQSVDYRYNIRGWLTSINNAELSNDGGTTNDDSNDYFGMELRYDSVVSGMSNTAYYNGNISSTLWKGPGASGAADQRSYKYTYDQTDKLTAATFQANTGSAWTKESNTLNENLSYDANGNILKLQRHQNQRGLSGTTITSSPQAIDSLTYTYATGNQMSKVEDAVATTVGTGDFKNGASTTTEYTYDVNGNVLSDANKGLDSVKYNVLGKAYRIKFHSGHVLAYTFDAAGNKLKMAFTHGDTTVTTDYVGGFVYVNSALNFFSSPEGRVVKNGSNFEYQYAISDHQGNTRVLFTSATQPTQSILATYETLNQSSEAGKFLNYPSGANINPVSTNNQDSGGSHSELLTGAYNSQIGVSHSYKVYAGDSVKIEAYARYDAPTATGSGLAGFAAALVSAFGLPGYTSGETGNATAALNTWGTIAAGGYSDGSTDNTDVKAFVNIILFDQNYNFLDVAYAQVTATGSPGYISAKYKVKEAGYAFVYISNENAYVADAYFDDVKMSYIPSQVLQYNEYYPFGLQASARTWTRDSTTNNFLYDAGNELNTASLWYETFFRGYDPQLGRFHQVDPLTDRYSSLSPYNYANNDPIFWNDRMGANPVSIVGNTIYIDWDEAGDFGGVWAPEADGTGGGGSSGSWTNFTSETQAFGALLTYVNTTGGWANTLQKTSANTSVSGYTTFNPYVSSHDGVNGVGGEVYFENGQAFAYTTSPIQNVDGHWDQVVGGEMNLVTGGTDQDSQGDQTWYYMSRDGAPHGMVYDPIGGFIYEINQVPGQSKWEQLEGLILNSFPSNNVKVNISVAYQYERGSAEWSSLWDREEGNTFLLSPVTVSDPAAATAWFQGQTGNSWNYSIGADNCAHYSVQGLNAGGAGINFLGPLPSSFPIAPTMTWTAGQAYPVPR